MSFLRFLQASVDPNASAVVDEASKEAANNPSWLSSLSPLFMIAVFGVVFYLFILRPEKKRKKAAEEQRDSMRVGDTVITIGGITGEIESIRKETITIFTGNNSIDLQKWAIRSVEPAEEEDEVTEEE
ncbi:MAG: preprotein translocase subunit YajC [Clostridia bacterium]|nr:preprotein translocase subunit YajC [Clostridia bacterium]